MDDLNEELVLIIVIIIINKREGGERIDSVVHNRYNRHKDEKNSANILQMKGLVIREL